MIIRVLRISANYFTWILAFQLSGFLLSCNQVMDSVTSKQKPLFELIDNDAAGIAFVNQVDYTEEFNTYTYRNFYNGAGVGLGDFNNDGLVDIYFCGNLVPNRMYLNKGEMKFEDITNKAGVACDGVWSTGVSIADINGDGWQDVYVCKSGSPGGENRHNELFINNGDLTFSEKAAEFGIDDEGLSTHAAFFDFDKDGDLDCYLLNNSFRSVGGYDLIKDQRKIRDPKGGNKLYRNENGYYTDVSEAAGIYGSAIGFGLGVTVGDVNRDGWPDIYVSNDFFEKDYLYLNKHDGTFKECLEDQVRELSLGSMGADMADINNDGYPEIFVTEMTPEGEARLKTKGMFESWDKYQLNIKTGYYRQFARNVLQLNNRNGSFSEIGRYAGVYATDWSWGALIFDMDNDGWKDIFVANGIYKDLLDQDYINFYSNPAIVRQLIKSEEQAILKMIEEIPSERIPNYTFRNNGNLTFSNMAAAWGLDIPSHSNGSAYGDLDNDGDLDIVVNNVNMPPFIFRNRSMEQQSNNYINVQLKGNKMNSQAIGSRVTLYAGNSRFYQELLPMRGFQSNVDSRLNFGVGKALMIDSMIVEWPDDRITRQYNIPVNRFVIIRADDADLKNNNLPEDILIELLYPVEENNFISYAHHENDFVDFDRDRLLYHMVSNEGPHMGIADINGDNLEDIYICGAKDSPGSMFVQTARGDFKQTNMDLFQKDKVSEDTDCAFFDADNDGDMDLYVASGGNEFPSSSTALIDRLYFNDGNGNFKKSAQLLPTTIFESTSCVRPADFDEDGDIDLFVGIRLLPFFYGLPVNGYILENDGKGNFRNITGAVAPGLIKTGMIRDMQWADINNDKKMDIIIAGDQMPVKIFINQDNKFTDITEKAGLSFSCGWWNTIEKADLDRDGDVDFVLGNHGRNSRFKASAEKPIITYMNDFDQNGSNEMIICSYNGDTSYPMTMKQDLVMQIPGLKKKYLTFASYKQKTIQDIFTPEQIESSFIINTFLLTTVLLINDGNGVFHMIELPVEAQLSPVYAIKVLDLNKDGNLDILMGGNLYRSKPEAGIYDASYGVTLIGDGKNNFHTIANKESGFFVKGEIRDIETVQVGNNEVIFVAVNNDSLRTFRIQ